jgi:hypothetical protein
LPLVLLELQLSLAAYTDFTKLSKIAEEGRTEVHRLRNFAAKFPVAIAWG